MKQPDLAVIRKLWQEKTGLEWNDKRWSAMAEVLTETEDGRALLRQLCFVAAKNVWRGK